MKIANLTWTQSILDSYTPEMADRWFASRIEELLAAKKQFDIIDNKEGTLASLVDCTFKKRFGDVSPLTTILSSSYNNSDVFHELTYLLDSSQGYDLLVDVVIDWRKMFTSFPLGLEYGEENLDEVNRELRNTVRNNSLFDERFVAKAKVVHDSYKGTQKEKESLDAIWNYLSAWGNHGLKDVWLMILDIIPDKQILTYLGSRFGKEAYDDGLLRYNRSKAMSDALEKEGEK